MEKMKYMHKETGTMDDREGWIASYTTEELDRRGLTAEEAFTEDEGKTLIAIERQDKLTREQAIELVGIEAVEKVEAENCEPSNRVGFNGACQDDDLTEWSASVKVGDRVLTAYYYTDNEQDEAMAENDGDGSAIDWTIDHYSIV
jgi:hypothetical protein